VQIRELAFELHQGMIVAGNIAGAAGPGTHSGRGLDHGANDFGMLAHAEVVVGTPDDDVFRAVGRMPQGVRETPGDALKIGKHPITPFGAQPLQRGGEIAAIVDIRTVIGIGHWARFCRSLPGAYCNCRRLSRSVPGYLSRPSEAPSACCGINGAIQAMLG
jgi:hypothetical protein